MAEDIVTTTGIARHGATRLPSVEVDSFNIELKDDDGFLGDRASKGAFRKILDTLRKPLQKNGDDPLGKKSTEEIAKSELDDVLVGVDIGGTNIRCGVVDTCWKKSPDLSRAEVWKSELWRHADDEPTREGAVKRLVKMLKDLIASAETEGRKLAPFIGIACPGVIDADGSIEKGAQNLPGNWESSKFNLPASLVEAIPQVGDHDTAVLMHNDGVVQGLSEVRFMQDVARWGVLTIGTGLGNARFTNRRKENGKDEKKAKKGRD